MNTKKETQLRLASLINHRIKISKKKYPPEHTACKESSLKILDTLIAQRTTELRK